MCEVPLDEFFGALGGCQRQTRTRVLFHYSNEKKDFSLAIQEWRYHAFYEKQRYELASVDGKVDPEEGDNSDPRTSHCICSQHLMIVHVVQHRETNVRLPIGSECINKFLRDNEDIYIKMQKNMSKIRSRKRNENRKKKRGSKSGSGIDSVWIALASIFPRRHLTGKYVAFHVGN